MSQPGASAVHVDGQTRVARRLKNLRYRRIDLVDKGASHDVASGEGAHVVLFKRDGDAPEIVTIERDGAGYPIVRTGAVKKFLDGVLAKVSGLFDAVAKGEPMTFADAQRVRGVDALYSQLYGDCYALRDAISSALYSDTTNKAGAIKAAVQAYCAALIGNIDDWLGESDDAGLMKRAEDVTKAGRAISSERLRRLKEMHGTLGTFIAEHEDKSADDAGDKTKTSKGDPAMAETKSDVTKSDATPAAPAPAPAATPAPVAVAADAQKRLDEAAAENVALKKRLEDVETVAKAEREARLKGVYIAKAAGFKGLPVKADDDYAVFREIDEKLSPEVAKRVNELLAAGDAAFVQAGLFKAVGSGHPGGDGGSAFAEIERLAEAEVAKGAGVTKAQAIDKITRAHPELYKRHLEEQGRTTA